MGTAEITRVEKTGKELTFPRSSHSWEVLSRRVAKKKLDLSTFFSTGTSVPMDCIWFFESSERGPRFPEVTLVFNKNKFGARINLDKGGRTRLFWREDFASVLALSFPSLRSDYQKFRERKKQKLKPNPEPDHDVWMEFKKVSTKRYEVEFSQQVPQPQARKSRNPNWTRDELIVALNFYFQHYQNIPGKSSPEIRALSEFLNRLGKELGISGAETFRNDDGVYMKLMNFRRLDPRYSGKGLERGAKEDEIVWNKYSTNPDKLAQLSENIHLSLNGPIPSKYVSLDEDEEAEEGRLLTRQHRYRERDPKLVKRKKDWALRNYGVLLCEVCQFNFSESYGHRGDGYIECHHRKPVSELKPGQTTKLSDLSLVCSNCHRMIHRRRPWPTVKELKKVWNEAHPRD